MEAEMLLAKHKVFLEDLEKHTPTFEDTVNFGKQLQDAGHYGSHIIEARLDQLQAQWGDIGQKAAVRNKDLEENNLTQRVRNVFNLISGSLILDFKHVWKESLALYTNMTRMALIIFVLQIPDPSLINPLTI